ncbi:MAG: reverse transcriptase domain-containing protein [Pirellulaceae bacterium]
MPIPKPCTNEKQPYGILPESGTPEGTVHSPLLGNLHLDPLDHFVAAAGHEMVRFADDLGIVCRSREDIERANLPRSGNRGYGATLPASLTRTSPRTTAAVPTKRPLALLGS